MPLNVLMLQPSLPGYRVAVFRELAARSGINLRVAYSQVPNIPNATPDGFEAVTAPHRDLWIKKYTAVWHSPPPEYFNPEWCDAFVTNWNTRYVSLMPTVFKARAMQIPVVLWGHGFSKHESLWRRRLRASMVKPADAVVTYNYAAADDLVQAGVPRNKIFVALNSLDTTPVREASAAWRARPDDLAAFRAQHGLNDGPVLLFCSRLDPANRTDWLLSAAAELRRTHPGLKVVVIGNGPAKPALEEQVRRLGLDGSVIFTGAIYQESDLAPWFLSATAFVYPTNIGLSILHAMAYGLPVVTSDRLESQNPEIEALVPESNGLTFAHGSVSDLAGVIERLISEPQLRERLAANAASQRRFTIERMVDGLEGAIRYASRKRVGAASVTPQAA